VSGVANGRHLLERLPAGHLAQLREAPPFPVRQSEPVLADPLQQRRVLSTLALDHPSLVLSQPHPDPRRQEGAETSPPSLSSARLSRSASLNWSRIGYKPVGPSQGDVAVMPEIDREHTRHSFYGSRKIVLALANDGHTVNRKRVQRLMRVMGIEAVAPGPNTSKPRKKTRNIPIF
jgi:hypothetical protein